MARARFTGPPNPGPDGNDLGHEIAILGRRAVRRDDLIEDLPGDLLEEQADAWLMGDPDQPDQQYALPKALWQVEDQPKRRKAADKPQAAAKGE